MPDDALHAVHVQRLDTLEKNSELVWKAIDKIQDKLSGINAKLAGFGVVNTLILAWIAYKLTKGQP